MALQSMTPLATITLQSSTSQVTFSNIPNTYRDLVLIVEGTSNSPANAILYFNSDTTSSNYSNRYMNGDGSGSGRSGVDSNGAYIGGIYGSNRSINTITIFDYSATNKHKVRIGRLDVAGSTVGMVTGRWASNAAVNTIQFTTSALTMSQGTSLSLYGRIG